MKNFIIILLLLVIALPVCAKDKNEKTLYCSYISGGTDIYFTLEPITIKSNGYLMMQNKIVGKVTETNKENGEIFATLGGGATWSLETKRMLSIYTKPLENQIIYNFGSCVAK
jgi:hypothetical protein